MARIEYFEPENASPQIVKALDGKKKINIFRMIANSDGAGAEVLALGQRLSHGSTLDHVDREVVILRVGHLSQASYEIQQHTVVARRVGLSDEKIQAIGDYPKSEYAFDHSEIDLIAFTDAVVRETTPPEDVFRRVEKRFTKSQLVELVLLIGFYMMVSRVMNSFEIDHESGPVETFKIQLT
jgi:4-carboxymuconolactone decarboxylase